MEPIDQAQAGTEQLVGEILDRVADKWTLLVIDALEGQAEVRFTELRARIPGVSQKMLTKTLRQLERDGLVVRRVHAEVERARRAYEGRAADPERRLSERS